MTRYLSKITTIAFFVLFVFCFTTNEASTKKRKRNLHPHKTNICDLKKDEIIIIIKFLTLREALGMRIASNWLLENSMPKIAKENVKYLKPFLNYGYDKNIGFVLSRYCSTLNSDSYELRDINKNILQFYALFSRVKLRLNSYAFVLGLNAELVLYGGIGEYEEIIPTKFMKGTLCKTVMNKRSIVAVVYTNDGVKFFTVGDPDFYSNAVQEKIEQENSVEDVFWLPMCTANTCSVWNDCTLKLYSWGDFHASENEMSPPKEILENVKQVKKNNKAICVRFRNGTIATWGNQMFGGKIPETMKLKLTNIGAIENTRGAFAALSHNGNVFAWGHSRFGGKIPEDIQPLLQNIKEIVSSKKAFAVCTFDGNVFAWGDANYGGNPAQENEEIQSSLQNIKCLEATKKAFAALRHDGTVFTWGDPNYGGTIPPEIQAQLYNVEQIYTVCDKQFVAIFNDGRQGVSWP